jgi:hypothetical protein
MKFFVLLFWRICIFQTGPETVPASNAFTLVIIAINALLNIVVQLFVGDAEVSLLRAVTISVVSLAGTGALVWFVMALMSLNNRVQQTVTAIFGVDIIMTTITSLAFSAAGSLVPQAAVFVITLLTLWSLAIYGFIFHRALNIHIGFGIAMALFVVIFSVAITQTALSQ